ncbi:nitroreductase family protein [Vibrio sp. ZSDZ34]|jgi:nitroreductase/dihydropteridine reductase|uniref:Nitroreductase family protein n=1 Tax=Vibrio gelatinilyticus TaxID=2893468 RepID=A0A9X1WCG1_9VIBR|nr:nitroreductase family protein [Vibrio gelatinilyticus]MCJ2377481.1 nitroreductase family protein [Vibrio gelatinilyticus]
MTHPIIADLNSRYTAKKYDATKRISTEDMDVIKESLRLSASSINSQPWKFIVLESEEAKERFHGTFSNMFQFNQPHAREASHTILFAHNPSFDKVQYRKVVDAEVSSGHLPAERYNDMLEGAFGFVELNTDESGFNGNWTKAQSYIALGNTLHTLARMGIASTSMEGVDAKLIGEEFKDELGGYVCDFALALGYPKLDEDYNYGLPKARLPLEEIITVL